MSTDVTRCYLKRGDCCPVRRKGEVILEISNEITRCDQKPAAECLKCNPIIKNSVAKLLEIDKRFAENTEYSEVPHLTYQEVSIIDIGESQ